MPSSATIDSIYRYPVKGLTPEPLAAGLRLQPVPGLLLLSAGAQPPTSLAIGSFSLF
jgi:hypothetical protein